LREYVATLYDEGDEDYPLFLEPATFDDAIIGMAERLDMHVVAYDREHVVDILAQDMSLEDAEEYFQFNTLGAWMGKGTPVFINLTHNADDA